MSAEKISSLEKDVDLMRETVVTLASEIKQSTKATVELTGEIRHMVKSHEKLESRVENVERKTAELDKKEAIRQSDDQVIIWIKRAVVLSLVAAVMGLILTR